MRLAGQVERLHLGDGRPQAGGHVEEPAQRKEHTDRQGEGGAPAPGDPLDRIRPAGPPVDGQADHRQRADDQPQHRPPGAGQRHRARLGVEVALADHQPCRRRPPGQRQPKTAATGLIKADRSRHRHPGHQPQRLGRHDRSRPPEASRPPARRSRRHADHRQDGHQRQHDRARQVAAARREERPQERPRRGASGARHGGQRPGDHRSRPQQPEVSNRQAAHQERAEGVQQAGAQRRHRSERGHATGHAGGRRRQQHDDQDLHHECGGTPGRAECPQQGEGTAPRDVGTDPQQHGGDGEVGQHGLIEVEPGAPVEPRADDDDCADRTGRPRQPSLRGRHLHG